MAELAKPEVKERLMGELAETRQEIAFINMARVFPLEVPLDYEPAEEDSVAAMAESQGRDAYDLFYDLMLEDGGKRMFFAPTLNYSEFNYEVVRKMLTHPRAALGLDDAGAHCGVICDASMPTFMLTHWARDRSRGEGLPLEFVVKKMTSDTARLYGLTTAASCARA